MEGEGGTPQGGHCHLSHLVFLSFSRLVSQKSQIEQFNIIMDTNTDSYRTSSTIRVISMPRPTLYRTATSTDGVDATTTTPSVHAKAPATTSTTSAAATTTTTSAAATATSSTATSSCSTT